VRIQIIGLGAVGEAQAYLATKLGHEVLGFDPGKISSNWAEIGKTVERNVDISFICVPEAFAEQALKNLVTENVKGLYVIKSTVPPGTTVSLSDKYGVHICHNPEFLVEKAAFNDVTHPDVVVIGQCCAEHAALIKNFYVPLRCPIVVTHPTTSETVKLTLNSYLATLISFWNQVDMVTSKAGVSTAEVASIVKQNPRVSAYGTDFFGSPFGGKCLPKDLNQFIQYSHQVGANPQLFENIKEFNLGVKKS
jgi:nucleotide sugar dehydrogenase